MVPRFIGTIRRSIKMLSTYSFWLGWALGLQIALDAFLLYAYFTTPREDLVRNCVKDSTDQNVINSCNSAFNVGKGAMIGGVVVNLLIQACAYPVPSPPISGRTAARRAARRAAVRFSFVQLFDYFGRSQS